MSCVTTHSLLIQACSGLAGIAVGLGLIRLKYWLEERKAGKAHRDYMRALNKHLAKKGIKQ